MKLIPIFLLFTTLSVFSQKTVFDIARSGTLDEIKTLHKQNPDAINAVNENGFSVLILATYRSNNEVANFLIQNVKDVDFTCSLGSALMAATYKSNNVIVQNLLKKGANPNIKDTNGMTSLMLAAQFGNVEIIKLLLAHKADKSLLNNEEKSAFEFAVFSGNNEIIEHLK